ncbi:unnamed protein product [Sphagnum troendelagicum]|uniref:Phthiocerol/phthiodiolone dimycocerosyl transferase C-terminal domain-containing protein n=1 Tax=Sphagnum troendelagicum TaxID=128251 RepID=A0ABP0TT04_9BRYO
MTAETLLHPEEGFPDTQYTNGACSASYKIAPTTIEGSTPDPTKEAREEGILSLEGPYDRLLGDTEENWCRAIAGGTGITVLGVLFSQQLDPSLLQLAVDVVQLNHPRLRSELIWIQGKPAFRVSNNPCVNIQVLDETGSEESLATNNTDFEHAKTTENGNAENMEKSEAEGRSWLTLIETELNTNLWHEKAIHSLEGMKLFVVRLHHLPCNRSLVTLRVHTATCDRVSAATVLRDILKAFVNIRKGKGKEEENSSMKLMSVEAAIPPGKANKPFWAHGIDLLGYSLGSKWHALLPFEEPCMPRQTRLIRSSLSFEHTQALLQACSNAKTSLYGAMCAAGLKAAATLKELGNRSEHFAIVTLVDCRQYLDPVLSDSTVGFYHSALMNTHHLNEMAEFWELARCCSDSLNNAIKNRKHFTDMGDLNYLMYQAIMHPNLTPSNSLRTSLLVAFKDTMTDNLKEVTDALGVEDYVGCSSIHGVGPSLAIFDSIRNGQLCCANVYPYPLHSHSQMQTLVNTMMDNLIKFIP